MRRTAGGFLYDFVVYAVIVLVCIVTLYPFIYVLSVSVSEPNSVLKNEVILLPKGFNLNSYATVLKYDGIWVAYLNTLFYTVVGTSISLIMTALAAYPLSRKDWKFRNTGTIFLAITLWFGGGMIPFFLVFRHLNLLDTRLSVLLYAAISTFYIIVMRTYFESLPKELEESAKIDGANDLRILWTIVVPLSKPVFAVIGLYYAVAKWNSFFWEMILLKNNALMPLQVMLVRIIRDSVFGQEIQRVMTQGEKVIPITIQYSAIVITVLPIIMVYPFLQKYFVKGVMIGAIKS